MSNPSLNEFIEKSNGNVGRLASLINGKDVVELLTEARSSALAASVLDDFATAKKYARIALAVLSTIPDGQMQGISSQTWDRTAIVEFIKQMDRQETETSTTTGCGFTTCDVEYTGTRGACGC